MYVRAVYDIDAWNKQTIEDVETHSLKSWVDDNPEYSIFRINNIKDKQQIKNIILRLVISNPNKWKKGFQLLILTDDFIKSLPNIVTEDQKESFKCLHANITNTTYKTFFKCIQYTFLNCNNLDLIIYCDFEDIGKLIQDLSDEEFTWLINQKEKKRRKQTVIDIKNYYFKNNIYTMPKYITR